MKHLLLLLLLAGLGAAAGCGGSMPPPMEDGGSSDGGGDGGLLPFGQPCATNAQCESNLCFVGGNRTFCSLHCTMATAATDCPVPPTSGTCNMQGYCKP
jgi:hypothetical protein